MRGLTLGALAGLSLGWGAALTVERERQVAGPAGWTLEHPDIPVQLADLAGPALLPGDGWPLDSHGLLSIDADRPGVSTRASIPPTARLELSLGSGRGAAMTANRVAGRVSLTELSQGSLDVRGPTPRQPELRCDGQLSLPTDETLSMSLQSVAGGVVASLGQESVRCQADVQGSRVSLRAGLVRVGLHQVTAGSTPFAAPGPAWLWRLCGGLVGAAVGVGTISLGVRLGLRAALVALALAPGLLAAWLAGQDQVAALQTLRVAADHPLRWGVGSCLVLILVGLVAVAQLSWVRRPGPSAAALPLGALPLRALPLGALPLGALPLGALPLGALPLGAGAALALPASLAYGAAGLLALAVGPLLALALAAALRWLGPQAQPERAVGGALACAVVAGTVAALLDPYYGHAVLFAAAGGLLLGLLLWANAHAASVRAFNLVSLACVVGLLASAEQALTWTRTGASLVGISSRGDVELAERGTSSAWGSFEAIETTRRFSDYPSEHYPVKPPPRTAPVRVVALGSSSTAGAYQNDDISQFWPAELEHLLGGGVQVVNQGVGGWTSLHVRRYVETRSDLLDADIAVVYLGHNDLMTRSPRPYRDLHRDFVAGRRGATWLSSALGSVRLYQLLRNAVQGSLDRQGGAAVPPEHARENLAAVIDIIRASGGRTLLVTEAVSPDPAVMAPYSEILEELAEAPDVAWLDGSLLVSDAAAGDAFLDDCHLTRRGHRLLAQWVAEVLREQRWLTPPAPAGR